MVPIFGKEKTQKNIKIFNFLLKSKANFESGRKFDSTYLANDLLDTLLLDSFTHYPFKFT